jgi:long-chain acyl-CoA synthetase
MPENVPNDIWADSGLGGALRPETHHDGRKMLCFTERPPTLAHMFDDLVGRFPLRPAIVEDRTITYRELDDLVGKISASLSATNVLRGDRVALFLGNCWEFLACVLACCRIGAIVVPIGTRQRHAELAFLLNDSEAKVLVFEADLADSVPGSDELPALRHRFAIRGTAPRARPFADLLAAREPVTRAADLRDEDVAAILYTSGTTGRPKGAQLTHLGIVHSALTFCPLLCVERGRSRAGCSSAFSRNRPGWRRAVNHYRWRERDPDASSLQNSGFSGARRPRADYYSILVPTIYTLCVMSPELTIHDLSSWRIGCFGGAPMRLQLLRCWRRNCRICNYSMPMERDDLALNYHAANKMARSH